MATEGREITIARKDEDEFMFQCLFHNQRRFDEHCGGAAPHFNSLGETRALITAGENHAECDQCLLGIYAKDERVWMWSWAIFPDNARFAALRPRLEELELAQYPFVVLKNEHARMWLFACLSTYLDLDHIIQVPAPDADGREEHCVIGLTNLRWDHGLSEAAGAHRAGQESQSAAD